MPPRAENDHPSDRSIARWVAGTLTYAAAVFPVAYVWHLVAFPSVYEATGAYGREDPIVALGFLTIMFQGGLVAYVFPRFYPGARTVGDGVWFGLGVGFLIWTSQVIAEAAKDEIALLGTFLGIETAYFAVQFALVGLALGFLYRRR